MARITRKHLLLPAALGLALTASGCESFDKMNPFAEREKILPGNRTPVFPQGVPGVDYNAAPPQPANSTSGREMPTQTPTMTPVPAQ